MPFFHVLLSVDTDQSKLRSVLADLSEEQLKAQVVLPYRKGTTLICGNEIIPVSTIRKIHVVHTARPNEHERKAIHAKSIKEIEKINRESSGLVFLSPGRGYDPEDILEAGEDVTPQYIVGPPGSAAGPGVLVRFLSSQWTVGIGTGLLVAAAVWWLGWG